MDATFPASSRHLAYERVRRSALGLALVAALLAAWVGWFFGTKVAVYETSETARLQVGRAAHPVDAPVPGRIVAIRMVLGAEVREGDPLVELDSEPPRLEREEARAARRTLGAAGCAPRRGRLAGRGSRRVPPRGKEARALRMCRRALATKERQLGRRHPDVAMTLNNLAVLLKNGGRLPEAGRHYRRAISIFERAFRGSDPRVATCRANYRKLLWESRRGRAPVGGAPGRRAPVDPGPQPGSPM